MSRWMGGRAQEKSGNYRATSQFYEEESEILSVSRGRITEWESHTNGKEQEQNRRGR